VPCRFCDGGPPTMTEGSCSVCGSPDSELVAPSVSGRVQLATNAEKLPMGSDEAANVVDAHNVLGMYEPSKVELATFILKQLFEGNSFDPNAILGTVNVDVVVPVYRVGEASADERRGTYLLIDKESLLLLTPTGTTNLSHALDFLGPPEQLVGKYAAIVSDPQRAALDAEGER
jgi:hypothetical protein